MVILFFMVFSKAPKAIFFFLAIPSKPWSSTSWFFQSSQSCCILLHGFFQSFQSSQSCVIFILGFFFSKTPWLWFFFFLAKTSKSCFFPKFLKSSFSSWIFPKLPKLLSSSWFFPKLHDRGHLVLLLVTS